MLGQYKFRGTVCLNQMSFSVSFCAPIFHYWPTKKTTLKKFTPIRIQIISICGRNIRCVTAVCVLLNSTNGNIKFLSTLL